MPVLSRLPKQSNKRELARQAMLASVEVRDDAGLDFDDPICVYDLCEHLGITVRFVHINMEGMYDRIPKPRIHLSALRPLVRRTFNCAHELGHHIFGHGSTIDEMKDNAEIIQEFDPKEFLADSFAAFLLMPPLGIRQAFAERGCNPETATPNDIFSISCSFGVGYETLITHLTYGLQEMSEDRAKNLRASSPKAIREQLLGRPSKTPLIVANAYWKVPFLDAEMETHLFLPKGSIASSDIIQPEFDLEGGRLFRAARPGVVKVYCTAESWTTLIRISRAKYEEDPDVGEDPYVGFVGLSRFRHMEDVHND